MSRVAREGVLEAVTLRWDLNDTWHPAMRHSWGKSIPDTWNSSCKALGLDSWCAGEIARRQLDWRKVS